MQANHVWVCGCVLQRCTFRVICNRPANCWLLSVVKLCLYGMCFAKVYVPVWESSQRIACAFRVICNRPANCWLLSVVKLCLYGFVLQRFAFRDLVTYVCVFGRIWKSSQRNVFCKGVRSGLGILPTDCVYVPGDL